MGRVGDFVRIDADVAGRDPRHQPVEVVRREAALPAQVALDQRLQQAGEAGMRGQLHLEGQALALVQAHRAGAGHRQAQPFARQVLLVAAMAGFVDGAGEALQEAVVAVARGHPHILRHAAAEGMGALVQPAGLEVEAQQLHGVQPERTLRRGRERPLRVDEAVSGLTLHHLADQAGQPLAQVAEDAVHLRRAHARLVLVEQRVVAAQARILGQVLRLLPRVADDRSQVLDMAGPVVGRALLAPFMLAVRVRQRAGLDEPLGHRVGRAPHAAHLAQRGPLEIVQRLLRGFVEQLLQRRIGAQLVQQAAHLGQRLGARLRAARRHEGGLVPRRDRLQVGQTVDALVALAQGVVGRGAGGAHGGSPVGVPHCASDGRGSRQSRPARAGRRRAQSSMATPAEVISR